MSLLVGFGIANEPRLFGKMLKRAPFMLYMNPPRIGDEDLSAGSEGDVSGGVAYGALKVLQLLKAQNFPDLDKIVRTQPSILLVEALEVGARATFLSNLFLEGMSSPSSISAASSPSSLPVSTSLAVVPMRDHGVSNAAKEVKEMRSEVCANSLASISGDKLVPHSDLFCDISKGSSAFVTRTVPFTRKEYEIKDSQGSSVESRVQVPVGKDYSYLAGKGPGSGSGSVAGPGMGTEYVKRITTSQRVLSTIIVRAEGSVLTETVKMTESSHEIIEILSGPNIKEESITKIEKIEKVEIIEVTRVKAEGFTGRDDPREMLGALLLSYPAVLSIEHRWEALQPHICTFNFLFCRIIAGGIITYFIYCQVLSLILP